MRDTQLGDGYITGVMHLVLSSLQLSLCSHASTRVRVVLFVPSKRSPAPAPDPLNVQEMQEHIDEKRRAMAAEAFMHAKSYASAWT